MNNTDLILVCLAFYAVLFVPLFVLFWHCNRRIKMTPEQWEELFKMKDGNNG